MSYFKDGAFRIDLNDAYDIKQIMTAIYAKLKNNSEKNLEQKEVIDWFHEQTNANKSFLIVFDKFEQIKKPKVMKELNEFIIQFDWWDDIDENYHFDHEEGMSEYK